MTAQQKSHLLPDDLVTTAGTFSSEEAGSDGKHLVGQDGQVVISWVTQKLREATADRGGKAGHLLRGPAC